MIRMDKSEYSWKIPEGLGKSWKILGKSWKILGRSWKSVE